MKNQRKFEDIVAEIFSIDLGLPIMDALAEKTKMIERALAEYNAEKAAQRRAEDRARGDFDDEA